MTPAAEMSLLAGLLSYLYRLTSHAGVTLEQEQTADATRARISRRQHILFPSAPDICRSEPTAAPHETLPHRRRSGARPRRPR